VDKPLEVLVGELLAQRGLTLAVAESCTGGLISHRITNVSGSSRYFLGGTTAYANEIKMKLLGVSPATLEAQGAVSAETVLQMARGVRQAFGVDIGISTSGIAGPTGGTPDKPVGTTWIGFSSHEGEDARHFLFQGDRVSIKQQATEAALQLLADHLQVIYL
jgi:nicotinamide-nucleotide amidase